MLSRSAFEAMCAGRFQSVGAISRESADFFARVAVSEFLADNGIAYGAAGWAWDEAQAHALVDKELAYWGEESVA